MRHHARRCTAWFACVLFACVAPSVQAGNAKPLRGVASFSILADMAREVASDAVHFTALVGPNADAHVYEPTPADVRRVARADLLLVNGLHFEGWMTRLVQASGYRGPVVVATRGITPRRSGDGFDPHAWQSLVHAERYVENIRAALVRLRPADAAMFDHRARAYRQRLRALDARIRRSFAAIPPGQRVVVTSHDAFGYFGDAYGVRFVAAQGGSTEATTSAADVALLVAQLREHRARAVFVENIGDARLLRGLAADAGVHVGGKLYSDALSTRDGPAASYLALMAYNARVLQRALSGGAADRPAGGRPGR